MQIYIFILTTQNIYIKTPFIYKITPFEW